MSDELIMGETAPDIRDRDRAIFELGRALGHATTLLMSLRRISLPLHDILRLEALLANIQAAARYLGVTIGNESDADS